MSAPLRLSWDRVRGQRLRRHGLVDPYPAGSAALVASTVCGIHTQVGSAAALSLGRRVSGADVELLPTALWTDRTLVKTYGPRGTVHVFPADELALWTAATRAMPAKGSRQAPAGMAELELSPEQVAQLRAAVLSAASGTQLTRAELGAVITAECGPWVETTATYAFVSRSGHIRVMSWPRLKRPDMAWPTGAPSPAAVAASSSVDPCRCCSSTAS